MFVVLGQVGLDIGLLSLTLRRGATFATFSKRDMKFDWLIQLEQREVADSPRID